jgi:uncharacterized damage-inducible protein DinB
MKSISDLVVEFDREMAKTRRILERVPDDKFAWKPHEKSFVLGKLANHLAAMPALVAAVVRGKAKRMPDAVSQVELLEAFDKNLEVGREALVGADQEHIAAVVPALNMTRAELLRERVMSHMIHHRGQLTVYLRLLDVPVPGMYGASADEI